MQKGKLIAKINLTTITPRAQNARMKTHDQTLDVPGAPMRITRTGDTLKIEYTPRHSRVAAVATISPKQLENWARAQIRKALAP